MPRTDPKPTSLLLIMVLLAAVGSVVIFTIGNKVLIISIAILIVLLGIYTVRVAVRRLK